MQTDWTAECLQAEAGQRCKRGTTRSCCMIAKVGVIGAGVMGAEHARLLSTMVSGAEVTAVSDPDAKRLARAIETCPTARQFADPLALIRDKAVDAVLIASPDDTHGALVMACLEIEKAVLCE